jgi:hypothetical protein
VLGIIALPACCFFVLGIVAVITGFLARRQVDASGGRLKGAGSAMAGIVLGVTALVIGVVYYILGFAGAYDG